MIFSSVLRIALALLAWFVNYNYLPEYYSPVAWVVAALIIAFIIFRDVTRQRE
ncbi:hypothetical protein ACEQMU_004776 [Salmonella enterica]